MKRITTALVLTLAAAASATAQTQLRLGDDSCAVPDDAALTIIPAVAVNEREEIFAATPSRRSVAVLTRDGSIDEIFGRGPAAAVLEKATWMGLRGDTLWVHEPAPGSAAIFQGNDLIQVTSVASSLAGAAHRPLALLGDGSWIFVPNAPFEGDRVAPVLRIDGTGSDADTLALVRPPGDPPVIEIAGRRVLLPRRFSDHPLISISPDGGRLILVDRSIAATEAESAFRVVVTRIEGDTLLDRSYPYEPVPIPGELIDSLSAAEADHVGAIAGSNPSEIVGQIAAGYGIPAALPPVSAVHYTTSGHIWIRRERDGAPTSIWWLLSPGGDHVGTMHAPSEIRVAAASAERFWTYEPVPTPVCRIRINPVEEHP